MAQRTLLTPTGINLTTFVNDLLVTERRRGFDGTVTLPELRLLARVVVHETGLIDMTTSVPAQTFGEFK